MDKAQTINNFWSSFGIPAYDESSVPTGDNAPNFPYITYSYADDSFGDMIPLTASVWYRETSWENITNKVKQIGDKISRGGIILPCDGGAIWIVRGTPFSQRMASDFTSRVENADTTYKRISINIQVQFITND